MMWFLFAEIANLFEKNEMCDFLRRNYNFLG